MTEIDAATGGLVRVIASVPNVPFAITADPAGVWLMTNLGAKAVDGSRPDGAVDEFSAATGRLIRRMAAPPFFFLLGYASKLPRTQRYYSGVAAAGV